MTDNLYIQAQDINGDTCYRCRCKFIPSQWGDKPLPPEDYDGPWLEDTKDDQGNIEWHRYNHDAIRWQHYGGYAGRFDTIQRTLILCSKCTDEVLGPYIREHFYMFSSPEEFHYERRQNRDDELIQRKWDSRRRRRQLRSIVEEKPETPQNTRLL